MPLNKVLSQTGELAHARPPAAERLYLGRTPRTMAVTIYDAIFEDARGREVTRIFNDGKELRIALRGVNFVGSDFDALVPEDSELDLARSLFALNRNELCSCRLEWTMPLVLEQRGESYVGALRVELVLGDPLPNGTLSAEDLALELETASVTLRSSGRSGWFEDELLELVQKLTGEATRIRSCITCAFSDYSPYGHGLFGDLACFRGAKDDYSRVTDKGGLFAIWNRLTEYVQETYVCGEFRPRVPGTGYRG